MSTFTGGYREVASPLTPEMLAPLPTNSVGIDFSEPLTPEEYRQLADLLERHPNKRLYAHQLGWTRHDPITDLTFLRFFPELRVFSCGLKSLHTLEGIEHLQQAHTLFIFKSWNRMSAAPLATLTRLDDLMLDGHFTDRGALRDLTGLTKFSMGYATKLTDLNFLPPNLTRFWMNLGSVTNISALADLPHLQELSFHKVHSIADLTPLAQATTLNTINLAYLNKVTHLFDMTNLTELTDLTVSKLTNLTDLRPVLTAPNLHTLTAYGLPALHPDSWHDTCTGWLAAGKPPFWE